MGIDQDLFKIGSSAEIAIFDSKASWNFTKDDIFSKSHNSPFVGKELKGKVVATIVKAHIASQE
jgi:dihydroorotase